MRRSKSSAERCSFCGKGAADVPRLIAGPGVWICADCVVLCQGILREAPGDIVGNAGADRFFTLADGPGCAICAAAAGTSDAVSAELVGAVPGAYAVALAGDPPGHFVVVAEAHTPVGSSVEDSSAGATWRLAHEVALTVAKVLGSRVAMTYDVGLSTEPNERHVAFRVAPTFTFDRSSGVPTEPLPLEARVRELCARSGAAFRLL